MGRIFKPVTATPLSVLTKQIEQVRHRLRIGPESFTLLGSRADRLVDRSNPYADGYTISPTGQVITVEVRNSNNDYYKEKHSHIRHTTVDQENNPSLIMDRFEVRDLTTIEIAIIDSKSGTYEFKDHQVLKNLCFHLERYLAKVEMLGDKRYGIFNFDDKNTKLLTALFEKLSPRVTRHVNFERTGSVTGTPTDKGGKFPIRGTRICIPNKTI